MKLLRGVYLLTLKTPHLNATHDISGESCARKARVLSYAQAHYVELSNEKEPQLSTPSMRRAAMDLRVQLAGWHIQRFKRQFKRHSDGAESLPEMKRLATFL